MNAIGHSALTETARARVVRRCISGIPAGLSSVVLFRWSRPGRKVYGARQRHSFPPCRATQPCLAAGALCVALIVFYRASRVQRQQERDMKRTTFPRQLDLLDFQRDTHVALSKQAVVDLIEQLRQLLIELTDRQSLAPIPTQEARKP